ncbi:MAG: aminoacyl-tRNA hydrolase [Pyrinomonadaceae bacterium]
MISISDSNWLIVGLGNPGSEYAKSRHNLGFMLADRLAFDAQTQIKRAECQALIGRSEIDRVPVELAKPQTYMNLSGDAVGCLLKKPGRSIARLIAVSDDLALPFGKFRIRTKGSHGGHNGLRSIIDRLGTIDFTRLRIGIQPNHPISNSRNFVLENFSKQEAAEVENILEECASAIRSIITDGPEKAMAKWNSDLRVLNAE